MGDETWAANARGRRIAINGSWHKQQPCSNTTRFHDTIFGSTLLQHTEAHSRANQFGVEPYEENCSPWHTAELGQQMLAHLSAKYMADCA